MMSTKKETNFKLWWSTLNLCHLKETNLYFCLTHTWVKMSLFTAGVLPLGKQNQGRFLFKTLSSIKSSLLKLEQIEDWIADYCSKGLIMKASAYLPQSNNMCLCFFLTAASHAVLQRFKVLFLFLACSLSKDETETHIWNRNMFDM